MRLNWPSFAAALIVCSSATPAFAQTKPWLLHDAIGAPPSLKLSGSFRLRYEGLEGQFRPGADPTDSLTSLRTILTAEYKRGPFRIGGEIYDSRAYGGKLRGAVSANDVNTFEPVQAYVAMDFAEPFGPGTASSVQAGRFALNLGSRRLVASDDYRNTTNGFTGLKFDAKGPGDLTATALYALPQVRLPDDRPSVIDNKTRFDRESFDLTFWGGIISKPVTPGGPLLEAAYFNLNEKDAPGRPTRDRRLHTVSVRTIKNPVQSAFDFEAEAIHQSGSISASASATAAELDVDANFFHVDAGYSFDAPWKPRVSIEYDYASGDDSSSSFGRFDTLFGTRRSELGPSGIYGAVGRTNLSTPGIRLEIAPTKRLDAFVVYRGLWTASETDTFSSTGIVAPSGAAGSYAGQQVEGRVRYWLVPDSVRLEVNGAILAKGELLESVSKTGTTRYISVALSSSF